MGKHTGTGSGTRSDTPGDDGGRDARTQAQDAVHQRQQEALEQSRADPSQEEQQVRREQGGHDRPVGSDHKPHPRPKPDPDR